MCSVIPFTISQTYTQDDTLPSEIGQAPGDRGWSQVTEPVLEEFGTFTEVSVFDPECT